MAAEQCYNENKLPFVNVQTARNRFDFSYLDILSSTFGAPETLVGGGVETTGEGVEDGGGCGGRLTGLFIFGVCVPFGPNEPALVRTGEGFGTAAGLTVGAAPTTDEP